MARRPTRNITGIRGSGKVNYAEVWRVFECFSPGCDCLMKVSEDWIQAQKAAGQPVSSACPRCGFINSEDHFSAPRLLEHQVLVGADGSLVPDTVGLAMAYALGKDVNRTEPLGRDLGESFGHIAFVALPQMHDHNAFWL